MVKFSNNYYPKFPLSLNADFIYFSFGATLQAIEFIPILLDTRDICTRNRPFLHKDFSALCIFVADRFKGVAHLLGSLTDIGLKRR